VKPKAAGPGSDEHAVEGGKTMPISHRALPTFFALAGCAAAAASTQAPAQSGAQPGATVTIAGRSTTTVTGQRLAAPADPFESVISVSELPAGGMLPMHKHPWPRYVYVDLGRLSVRYEKTGLVREFGPGEGVVEAIDQWHEGRVIGDAPVRLIVFDQVPPGETNVVRR
jgi:quercetin dioxygenase-like cupin family protein